MNTIIGNTDSHSRIDHNSLSRLIREINRNENILEVLLGLDVETGAQIDFWKKDILVSVGVSAVGVEKKPDTNECSIKVFHKQRFTPPFNTVNFDEVTMKEYWSRPEQQEQLKVFRQEIYPSVVACMNDVFTYIELFRRNLDETRFKVKIVTDFPEFDVSWTDVYGIMYGARGNNLTLARSIDPFEDNTSERKPSYIGSSIPATGVMYEMTLLGLLVNANNRSEISKYRETHHVVDTLMFALGIDSSKCTEVHDHYPENDAAECAVKYLMIRYAMKGYKIA